MDQTSQTGSSSVTVEYTDPSGLFPAVQPVITNKLPLKNLHWKSPTRPVRSIESLRIGFTQAQHETDERKPSSDGASAAVTHRRHQIPGLRETPYLKIYLLRCDDNDTYKATARKALRDWIKSNSPASQPNAPTSNQEKHDAFEWMILHVVQDGDGTEKAAPTTKWGRTTMTVLEKVKADFNGTSKSAVDRVAQLRLPKPETKHKSPELQDQVEDFIEKMKNGILASFDLRVAQYEEDIKEKDSQRSLPGWNFCTFFILKEGLARGFENVGLFEDALLGYDELSVGLDMAISDQLEGEGAQHGNTFLTSSKDWQQRAKAALESRPSSNGGETADSLDIDARDFPIDSSKKSYRDMILASNISVLDFRTYVFSRQLMLLLRAAKAPSLVNKEVDERQNSTKRDKKPEDLMLLSEICERASEFISIAARTLRCDLEAGLADDETPAKSDVVNNLVSSWSYAAATQILVQTFTPSLALPESFLHAISKSAEAASADAKSDVPKRASSLITAANASRPSRNTEMISPDALSHPRPRSGSEVRKPVITPKTGSEQLASGRGDLLLMARRFLEEIAGRYGWEEKWNNLGLLFDDKGQGDMSEVSLDDDKKPSEEASKPSTLSGIELPALKAALRSREAFRSHYEDLTDQIYRHQITANRNASAQKALADMALLRFRQADYSAAASYFHQITPFYGNKRWILLEGVMLEMYARCLKELQKSEEHVRKVLRLLSKYAVYTQSNLSVREKTLDASSIFAENALVSEYVAELFKASSTLQKEVSAPLTDFFADLQVRPSVLHYADKDGFQMQLSLRFLLGRGIDIDSTKIRMVGASNAHNSEHWIEAATPTTIKSSPTKILVDSSSTMQGKYFVDRVEMRAGNLVFAMGGGRNMALPVGFREAAEAEEEDHRPYIYCYPPPEGLHARVVSPHLVNLEEMRTLELELNSGWNDIHTGTLRVRPATAGLRLRVAEAELVEGELTVTSNNDGNIEFTNLKPHSLVRFRIPYTVEEQHPTLSARAEVGYETARGRFSYSSTHSISSSLPISVNVQDTFKDEVLFSRFTISPAMMVPLRILKCSIPESDVYRVRSNVAESVAMDVFPKQPASLLYKIQQREDSVTSPGSRRSLRLSVDFTCVDDECFDAVEKTFRGSIVDSEFRRYASFLTTHIVEAFRRQLSTADMEVIGLVREVETLAYTSVGWDGLLAALKEPTEGLRAWLAEWHKKHPLITLPSQPSIPRRHILIPVDIPEIQVVHTAELQLHNLATDPTHASVGQMIEGELHLRHTRRWCSPAQRENSSTNGGGPLEFSYEIHANPEHWLVGGRRRGHFRAEAGETVRFAVMLVPQKPGHLLMPGLEIRTFTSTGGAAAAATATVNAGGQRRAIASEVDYRNHGETVRVVRDLRTTTVRLASGGGGGSSQSQSQSQRQHGGGAWLIESERR